MQINIMDRQLQTISRVPRTFGAMTNVTTFGGRVQLVLNIVIIYQYAAMQRLTVSSDRAFEV